MKAATQGVPARRRGILRRLLPALAMGMAVGFPLAVAAQVPSDFAWQGRYQAPAGAALARAELPAEALVRLRSAAAADLRVFDSQGRQQPHALAAPAEGPLPQRSPTARFAALPLADSQPASASQGLQVRVDDAGGARSVWVDTRPTAGATPGGRLPSVLFDTRAARETINGLRVEARLPPGAPVRVTLWASRDLAEWTAVPVNGRLYRFEGDGAPANLTLELGEPLALKDHYLRLDWTGQAGVEVHAITGLVRPAAAPPARVSVPLPAPREDGPQAWLWETGFARPLAALAVEPTEPNVLVPLRVWGRADPGERWQLLGQGLAYRFGNEPPGAPIPLNGGSMRWLRLEATHGLPLAGTPLKISAVFEPLQVVFVPGGVGPHQVVLGYPSLAAAALPLATLASAASLQPNEVPAARLVSAVSAPLDARPAWLDWLPAGTDGRALVLWAVLLAGVGLLGVVAWRLLRGLSVPPG